MLPDRVSNQGPLTYESGALPIALRGPAKAELRARVGRLQTSDFIAGRLKAALLFWFFMVILLLICGLLALWPPV